MRLRPIIHARDHEHGGSDVVRISWESVGDGGDGGGGGTTGLFMDTPGAEQEGGYLEIRANDTGGINILATGSGNGWDAGQLTLECNGGTTTVKNSDEGVIVYGTGHLTSGRITDLDSVLLETGADQPSLVLAGSNGVVISQAAINAGNEHGSLNLVFLFADTGNNLLRSPVILARTTDPHIAGALWNSSGTVKVSSG